MSPSGSLLLGDNFLYCRTTAKKHIRAGKVCWDMFFIYCLITSTFEHNFFHNVSLSSATHASMKNPNGEKKLIEIFRICYFLFS
jgi:hypothetical protein